MGVFEAIILGIVQGLTEFLPVSSTGHLILVRALFNAGESHPLAFDALLHLATATAVIIYFHKDILNLVHTLLRKLGRLPVNDKDLTVLYALIVGTIPAAVLGVLLESYMEDQFRNPLIVAVVLIAGSVLFIYAEWYYHNNAQVNVMTVSKGLKLGFFQSLALIPGMSRSGATIAGGMLLGLTRQEAARFAFLLAIPVILGAGGKKIIELIQSPDPVLWTPVLIGSATAFVTGLFAIHFMLSFVRRHTLWPFIWYRIILALFVIYVVMFG